MTGCLDSTSPVVLADSLMPALEHNDPIDLKRIPTSLLGKFRAAVMEGVDGSALWYSSHSRKYGHYFRDLTQLKALGLGFHSRDSFDHPRPRDLESASVYADRPNLTRFWFCVHLEVLVRDVDAL